MNPIVPALAAALLLGGPAVAVAGDQTVPNGINRVGATPTAAPVDVDVAVVDTGVDALHPDLNVAGGYDCTSLLPSPMPVFGGSRVVQGFANSDYAKPAADLNAPDYQDGHGHGTHVAGTIGALDNGFGVVGVAPGARIWGVKVLDENGAGTDATVNCGLQWVIDHADTIDVVNMSLGLVAGQDVTDLVANCRHGGPPDPRIITGERVELRERELICQIVDLGIPVVVAAGNSDNDVNQNLPAAYPEVITVSNFADFDGKPGGLAGTETGCPNAGGMDDKLWTSYNGTPTKEYTTSYGEGVEIAAPGTCVLSTLPGNAYGYFTGTSMSSPHVAGAVARIVAAHPELTVAEVTQELLGDAEPQPAGFNDVDAFAEPILRVGD